MTRRPKNIPSLSNVIVTIWPRDFFNDDADWTDSEFFLRDETNSAFRTREENERVIWSTGLVDFFEGTFLLQLLQCYIRDVTLNITVDRFRC